MGFQWTFAQNDTIELEESFLSDQKIFRNSQTQNVISFSDSIFNQNQPSLTNLLNFNTPIYFKENGAGMVSSPSFRGTTASQTVVLWNGININSQTTGQTDFNTVNIREFDKINVKGGGGNVAEVNSSVGGSIELINEIHFKNQFTNELFAKYGSFNTFGASLDSKYSNKDFSFNIGLTMFSSDNDFEFPDAKYIQEKNVNGQFYNNNASLALGYKINPKNTLKFFGNIFQAKRNLAVVTQYATKTRYEDYNTRSLVQWESRFNKFNSDLKVAYLTEKYRFFPELNDENPDLGDVKTLNSKYNLSYNLTQNFQLSSQLEYIRNEGFSDVEMGVKVRNLSSISLTAKHKIHPKLYYELSLRQELNEIHENPLLYSLGGRWDATDFYRIKFNASRNFRIPTYNDMYSPGVGNPDLLPESSYQAEIGNEFHNKNFSFSVTAYYNSVKNLIRWVPNSNSLGGILWRPFNVEDVKMYGIESVFAANKSFGKHNFGLNATYGYTISNDEKIDKQLTYVPFHKATASFGYGWQGFSMYYQFLFNGKIYHTTRNEAEHQLDHYFVSNLGLDYDFGKSNTYKVGFEILNLMDYEYEAVQARPMPGRNFHFFINIKI